MDHPYDPALDRLDVALLAVWHLAEAGRWDCLAELGVSRDAFLPPYLQLITEYTRPRHPERAQEAVFRMVQLCPTALDGALELIRRYQELCGAARVTMLADSHI